MIKRIYLEITNICNLNCPFCAKDHRTAAEMPLSMIERLFIEGKEITNYFYLHVLGEPTLHSQFKEVVELAEKHGIKIQLVTNGTNLERYTKLLLSSPAIRKISISLQGLFLDPNYQEHLISLEKFIESNQNKYLELRLWASKNQEAKNFINKYKDNCGVYFSEVEQFNWPDINNSINNPNHRCVGPKMMLCVLSDGVITPCCLDHNGIINLGNIKNTTFKEVLNSEKYLSILNGFANNKAINELCVHCDYKGGRRSEKN